MTKVVQIIPDDRDVFSCYEREQPFFGPAPAALLEGFAALAGDIEIHVVACSRRDTAAPEKLADNIYYHQVRVYHGYSRTFFLEAVWKVIKKIKEIDPDVVHGQGTEGYPALAAAFSGYPNCVTIHGNMREVAKKLRYRPFPHRHLVAGFEWLALKKTGAVFCNSTYTNRCVGSLSPKKPRVFNAVRSEFFDLCPEPESQSTCQPINSLTEESASPILLCIGHIHSYKNQIGLIHALDSFPSIGKFKLLFAGNCCSDSAYGRAFLKEIASRDWCEHVGRLELAELQKMLCHCAGVIHPTLEDSFGLAVAEAQVSGVPVAASAVGGIPDLIKHGETGLLFDPQNPEDIRQKVMDLLDPVISGKLAQNARAYAEAQYRPEVIARRHLELYGKLLSGDPLEYE